MGDPVTGATQAIIEGPGSRTNPKFSPDGTRIAFVRGVPLGSGSSLVVVRLDGTEEIVVVPSDFSERGVGPFAWTPDGTGLVVEIDSPPFRSPRGDGQLWLFDAAGQLAPRSLTPPLTATVGAIHLNPSAQVAPMFRPPASDLILNADRDRLEVFDADLRTATQLAREAHATHEPFIARDPTWSPDGARIAFEADRYDATGRQWIGGPDVFVLDADGGALRELGPGVNPTWSPDSAGVRFERLGS